ncbi:glycosyltransferase family 1 protein [Hypoxylon trugodes]|uniref:glycosyltransferase family 1 protein n=1 Tax=Hypoxylon trugodes TaxID=326681 RepID=UPI0021951DE9|nr:glycosyltransferase family 1 protein [Hypoxylon trugodes]KAI1388220.1 glycosyltransferase family 1 protein [Hypoxylon trugodes]
MAAQPQLNSTGQKPNHTQDSHNVDLINSSPLDKKIHPPAGTGNPPHPGSHQHTSTVEEPPSPTVDAKDLDSPSPIINSTKDTNNITTYSIKAALRKHQKCIDEMDTSRDRMMGQQIGDPFADLCSVIQQFFVLAYYGMGQLLLGIGIALWAVLSWALPVIGALFWFISTFLFVIIIVVWFNHKRIISKRQAREPRPEDPNSAKYALLVCGSGGHTGELIRMIKRSISPGSSKDHRRWAIATDDAMSFDKVIGFERALHNYCEARGIDPGTFDVQLFRRARSVHQSWLTTPFTCLLCIFDVLKMLIKGPEQRPTAAFKFPGVVVTDGPGSGVMFLLAVHVLKAFGRIPLDHMRTIYVETWARIRNLSYSGMIIQRFSLADVFIVQHPSIDRTFGSDYTGNMVAMPTQPRVPL